MKTFAVKTGIIWHGISIPAEFEPKHKPTVRRLHLKLSDERLRRKWELYFWAYRTAKLITFDLFVEPWDFRSKDQMDCTTPIELALSLLHPRATVWCNCGLTVENFRHEPGLRVLDATLRTLAEQLRDQA